MKNYYVEVTKSDAGYNMFGPFTEEGEAVARYITECSIQGKLRASLGGLTSIRVMSKYASSPEEKTVRSCEIKSSI